MKKVVVIGGSFCPPCQPLKEWLEAGGLSGHADFVYAESGMRNTFALVDKGKAVLPEFADFIPAVFIEDSNGNIVEIKNGATQTWIKDKLGMNGNGGIVINQGTEEETTTTEATEGTEMMFLEWVEDETFGIENEILLLGGLLLFIIIIGYILSRVGWLK